MHSSYMHKHSSNTSILLTYSVIHRNLDTSEWDTWFLVNIRAMNIKQELNCSSCQIWLACTQQDGYIWISQRMSSLSGCPNSIRNGTLASGVFSLDRHTPNSHRWQLYASTIKFPTFSWNYLKFAGCSHGNPSICTQSKMGHLPH